MPDEHLFLGQSGTRAARKKPRPPKPKVDGQRELSKERIPVETVCWCDCGCKRAIWRFMPMNLAHQVCNTCYTGACLKRDAKDDNDRQPAIGPGYDGKMPS